MSITWPGKYFTFAEFSKRSPGGLTPEGMTRAARLVPMLDDVRDIAGEPMRITSWWRPNQEREGPHKYGLAVDFCLSAWTQAKHDRILTHLPGLLATDDWRVVDQCIWYELPVGGHIHIGLTWIEGRDPRGQLLRASGTKTNTKYRSIRT